MRRCKKQKLGDVVLILGEIDIGQLDSCKAILQMKNFSLKLLMF